MYNKHMLDGSRYVRFNINGDVPLGRDRFEFSAHRMLLEKLDTVTNGVEFKKLGAKGWCIRTVEEADDIPLAAIGDTFEKAAMRLLRIVEFADSNWFESKSLNEF